MEAVIDVLHYYRITIIFVAFLLFCIWQYFRGRRTNLELVREYLAELEPTIRKYYTNYDGKLIQETPNVLKVYCLGRKSQHFTILGFAVSSERCRWWPVSRSSRTSSTT